MGLLVELLTSINTEEFFFTRKELEQRNPDVIFTTDSDCEILLHLYKEHGPDFLSKVRKVIFVRIHSFCPFVLADKHSIARALLFV
jgi:hypothetical protein